MIRKFRINRDEIVGTFVESTLRLLFFLFSLLDERSLY